MEKQVSGSTDFEMPYRYVFIGLGIQEVAKSHQKSYAGSTKIILKLYESIQFVASFLKVFETGISVIDSFSIPMNLTDGRFFEKNGLKVNFSRIWCKIGMKKRVKYLVHTL